MATRTAFWCLCRWGRSAAHTSPEWVQPPLCPSDSNPASDLGPFAPEPTAEAFLYLWCHKQMTGYSTKKPNRAAIAQRNHCSILTHGFEKVDSPLSPPWWTSGFTPPSPCLTRVLPCACYGQLQSLSKPSQLHPHTNIASSWTHSFSARAIRSGWPSAAANPLRKSQLLYTRAPPRPRKPLCSHSPLLTTILLQQPAPKDGHCHTVPSTNLISVLFLSHKRP